MSRNALALACSICLWPCFAFAVILLVTHSWMATSSLTSYECLRGGGRGSDSLEYLEVLGVGRGGCLSSPVNKLTPAGRDVVAGKVHRGKHGQYWCSLWLKEIVAAACPVLRCRPSARSEVLSQAMGLRP